MTLLSVNINKIATLRNSRGNNLPDLLKAAKDIQSFGAQGITIHPRPDERHIKYSDALSLKEIVNSCYKKQIQSIIVEGGLKTIQSFIDADLWDEARVFTSEKKIIHGVKAPKIKKVPLNKRKIDSDILSIYFN